MALKRDEHGPFRRAFWHCVTLVGPMLGPADWPIFGVSATLLKIEVRGRAGYKEDYRIFSRLSSVKYLNNSVHSGLPKLNPR